MSLHTIRRLTNHFTTRPRVALHGIATEVAQFNVYDNYRSRLAELS